MKKIENNKPITISKLAFLDEMLPFPRLEIDNNMETYGDDYALDIPLKFENLIKVIAAKTLTEEELLAVLGASKRETYWKDSATITYTA